MMEIEEFFKNREHHVVQYFDRHDAIGGQVYVKAEKIGGRVVISIGDQGNGEVPITTVDNDKEIQEFMRAFLKVVR